MSTSAPTHVVEVNGDAIERYVVAPQDVGLELTAPDAVTGGTPDVNAATTRAILAGEPGPRARPGRCSTRAPRSTPRASPTACARASTPPARRSTPGRRCARTDAYLELSRQLADA